MVALVASFLSGANVLTSVGCTEGGEILFNKVIIWRQSNVGSSVEVNTSFHDVPVLGTNDERKVETKWFLRLTS